MKNCNGDSEELKNYMVNIIDHYKVYLCSILAVKLLSLLFFIFIYLLFFFGGGGGKGGVLESCEHPRKDILVYFFTILLGKIF